MTLADLIARLEAADPSQVVRHGFTHPHSYRGDYMDLAFEPATDVPVAAMLAAARSALSATFQGYKGGEFTMGEHTWCWLSAEGDASGETISALLLDLMLAPAVPALQAPATDRPTLREAIRRAVCEAEGFAWDSNMLEPDEYGDHADAVLSRLPPIAERADVLREAADICDEAGAVYGSRGANDAAGAAFALMERFQRKANEAEYVATPCSVGGCEPGGEPCSTHERLMAHAEGDHELCAPDCGVVEAQQQPKEETRP